MYMSNLKHRNIFIGFKCIECGSHNLIDDYFKGELYCGDCGLIHSSLDEYVGLKRIQLHEPYPRYKLLENIHYKYTTGKTGKCRTMKHNLKDKQVIKHNKRSKKHKPYIYHIMD